VRLKLSAENELLLVRFVEEREFLPKERSRGMQWAIAFNIYFLASTDEELKNTVLLIDEPGIFLHIDAQKEMLKATLPDIVKQGNQVIYTTHLPYLIDRRHPERIRILEKIGESTQIGNKAWAESDFGALPEPVTTALGLNLEKAFLFGAKNLIVEGPVDQIYFEYLLKKFVPEFLEQITIVPAYGITRVPSVALFASLSGYSALGIVDGDRDIAGLQEKVSTTGQGLIKVEKLSMFLNNDSLTSEDLIPEEVFLDSVFEVYKRRLTSKKEFKRESLVLVKPRVSNLETFFAQMFGTKSHKLLKM
jgi:predicted ATP-dependent endonuclease of OLD family